MRIRSTRTLALLILLVLLPLIPAVQGLSSLHTLHRETSGAAHPWDAKERLAIDMRRAVVARSDGGKALRLLEEPAARAEVEQQVIRALVEYGASRHALAEQGTSPEEEALLLKIDTLSEALEQAFESSAAGAREAYPMQLFRQAQALDLELAALSALAADGGRRARDGITERYRTLSVNGLVFVGATLLFSIVCAGLLLRTTASAAGVLRPGRRADARPSTHADHTQAVGRAQLRERLERAVEHVQERGGGFALLRFELEGYDGVVERHGRAVAEELLKRAQRRVRGCLRETDLLVLLEKGGFAVAARNVSRSRDAAVVAAKVIETLSTPFELGSTTVQLGTDVGIALCPQDQQVADALIALADAAMIEARSNAGNTYHFASQSARSPA